MDFNKSIFAKQILLFQIFNIFYIFHKELKNKIEGELNSKETAKEDNVAGK